MFPRFRWTDLGVLVAMLALLAALALTHPGQVLQDAMAPTALVVVYAIWRWRGGS